MNIKEPANFSPDRIYRYTLYRSWPRPLTEAHMAGTGNDLIAFIGLNPSTADERTDDPTVRKCRTFAYRWSFTGMIMTNLFAYRATDPNVMKAHSKPIGPDNDAWLLEVVRQADMIVCAWGNDGEHIQRSTHVRELLAAAGKPLRCFGTNKNGEPKHPLYLSYETKVQIYTPYELQNSNVQER